MSTPPSPSHDRPTSVGFVRSLADHGDRIALITAERSWSYAEVAAEVDRRAALLGSTRRLVLLAAGNEPDAVLWYLAALAGHHPVIVATADGVDRLCAAYDPDVVLALVDGVRSPDERRPGSRHDLHPELALLLSTSGTTGSPKLVRLSATNLQSNAESIADYLGITEHDRAATTLPMAYSYGLSVLHSHLLRGAAIMLTDLSVVDPCFWDLFREHEGTSLAGVPYTFELLDRVGFADLDLPHLRVVTQAGGRLAPEAVARYAALGRERGWDFFVMYGQTEATARMAYLPPDRAGECTAAIGRAIPGGRLRVDPVDGAEDGVGELVYSGPNVMLGYAETPADLRLGRVVDELRTGDLARQRPDGMFEIVGRRSRFAKVFGLRIDLQHLETLLAAEGVTAICVESDDRVAVVAERPARAETVERVAAGAGLSERAVLPIEVDALPRRENGKPDVAAAQRIAAEAVSAPPAHAEPSDPTVVDAAALRDRFAVALRRPDATVDDTFVGLGGDSLSYVELSLVVEEAIGRLPADWHVTPIKELLAEEEPRGRGRFAEWRQVEMTVVLRASAILAILFTHVGLLTLSGGAHVMLAVAGFNLARFQLTEAPRRERVRRLSRSIARIVVPSVLFIGAMLVVSKADYRWSNVLLIDPFVRPVGERFDDLWRFWYIEVLVLFLLGALLLVSMKWFDRLERRRAFAVPMVLLGIALLERYEVFGEHHLGGPHVLAGDVVLWVFVLGWAMERARERWQRVLVSAITVVVTLGFFPEGLERAVFVIVGLLLLVWVRAIRLPAAVTKVLGLLAAASLFIYLTHWHVYPALMSVSPWVSLVGSAAFGVLAWWLWGRVTQLASIVWRRARTDEAADEAVLASH